ncbi:cytochrome P450 4V2-like [Macrosteles quadrilineatus]|uniref:cytochrome P450 4V2-like n=1 Tax=Macrosteles quadrilineatus TaxID=74068 RepID=UPI0023E0BB76|nr:cytochrome P450 4V2-like [Macrosteles quadrilineatus]
MKAAAAHTYSLFCMWAGPIPEICVQKPQDVQVLLTSSKALEKGPEYTFAQFVFRDGLITAPGAKWKISRRNMNPIFHRQNLNYLTRVFNRSSQQLVEDLASHDDGKVFDVFDSLLKASVTSVCSILFGLDIQSKMRNEDFDLGASITLRIAHLIIKRAASPWLWLDCFFNYFYKSELEELDKMWSRFTSQPMKVIENGELMTVPEAYSSIMKEHNTFSEEDLHAEMKTVLIAGSDTTAIGVSSCLLLLGTHPEIQEKLYNEISSVIGSEDQEVTPEDLNSLPYFDQVLKESLRLSPVVLCFKRTLSDDLKLSEYTVPKGASLVTSVIGLHFDPEVYPDPYEFKPERFTPENSAKRHPYSFLPFSGGPRNCIGKQYAMTSMKIMLAYILRRYKIHATDNILNLRYVFVISLLSIDGYKISLQRRNK